MGSAVERAMSALMSAHASQSLALRAENAALAAEVAALRARLGEAERERDVAREALERIVQWADAYPVSMFPEVDSQWLAEARAALVRDGKAIGQLTASNMRHVVTGVGEIARDVLSRRPDDAKEATP